MVRGDSAGGGQLRVLLQSLDWGTQPVYTGQGGAKVAYVNTLTKQSIYVKHTVEGSVSSREYSSFVTLQASRCSHQLAQVVPPRG